MARRQYLFGGGLPRLALSLIVTLAMVLGMCPTAGIAEEVEMEPEGEPVVEVKTEGNMVANQKKDGEEPALQAQGTQGNEEPALQAQKSEEPYNLWVGGVQVTDSNKGDVLVDDPVNKGKVSYTPASEKTPATLTLDGANITKGYVFTDKEYITYGYGIYYTGPAPSRSAAAPLRPAVRVVAYLPTA